MNETIKAPVAMPPAVRVVATVLLGLPGGLMWLGGLFATMVSMVYLIVVPPAERLGILKWFGASLVANLIGYTMVAVAAWINGAYHYRMPGRRLPAYVTMEIFDQLLAAVSVGFLVVSAISISFGEPAFPLIWLLAAAVGSCLLGFTMSLRSRCGRAWRDELLSAPKGAKPLY